MLTYAVDATLHSIFLKLLPYAVATPPEVAGVTLYSYVPSLRSVPSPEMSAFSIALTG